MKNFVTIAVAAALAVPLAASANPTLYGRVNVNLVHEDTDFFEDGSSEAWDVQNNASRVGVKGSEDLGNGLTAVYQFEFGVDASDSGDVSGRLAYVGVAGGFGVFAMGRQWTPYYNTVDKTDIMQINSMNDSYIGPSRIGNAVAYITPNFNGLTGTLALVVDNNGDAGDLAEVLNLGNTGDDGIDMVNASVDYSNGPLSAGVSYLGLEGDWDISIWGLGGKYTIGNFALIGQYENADDLDVDAWRVGGEAYLGNNTLRAVYGSVDIDGNEFDSWAIGVEHNFSKRTRVFAEYEDSELNGLWNAVMDAGAEQQRFGVGIRHDF